MRRIWRVLNIVAGLALAAFFIASALGYVTLQPLTLGIVGILIAAYTVEHYLFPQRTYDEGYRDGINLVLTGVDAPVAVVMKASLEQHFRDQE